MRAEQIAGLALALLGLLVVAVFIFPAQTGFLSAEAKGALMPQEADFTTQSLFFVLGAVLLVGGVSVFVLHRGEPAQQEEE